jgi:hypothetical protein
MEHNKEQAVQGCDARKAEQRYRAGYITFFRFQKERLHLQHETISYPAVQRSIVR